MALAVDTKHLLDTWIPELEELSNGIGLVCVDGSRERRLRLHRVCVYATVIHDASTCVQMFGRFRIVSGNSQECYRSVLWIVQLDFLDLSTRSWTSFTSSPGKRRRTLDPFHQVSPRCQDDTPRGHHPPEAKRFKGVRFRKDRNRWVAEMKPPKSQNKVSFGEFQSQTQAARVVDVAFHHYGKSLNFADTPRILSEHHQPASAGMNAEEKLKLVKKQTEWMKSRVSSLPSTSTQSAVVESANLFGILSTGDISGLRSFSAIGSSLILGGTDEADDAASQPRSWGFDVAGFDVADGEETMVHPEPLAAFVATEVQTADSVSPGPEQPFEIQSMCMDFLIMSPPASTFQVPSPGDFQGEVAGRLMELQNVESE